MPHDESPLAEKMRPHHPNDLLGQERIWAPGSALRRLVEEEKFTSLLFWGPPGTGKTSLAHIIAACQNRDVRFLSAVRHGVKDIRQVLDTSADSLRSRGKSLLVFMDEIHRLSKNQQDVLLPALETGVVKFIGATTENPSFEVNGAILSRSLVFQFGKISTAGMTAILKRALESDASALPRRDVEGDLIAAVARAADGDARRALNLLEAVVVAAPAEISPITTESLGDLSDALGLYYDKQGDAHYDTISAFIKSIRASHPDAAVYYLARMIDAGEDPVFIARRLVIAASEDVGNANPTALLVATSGMQAVHMVGMPEARIILAQITTYLAASPKSNRSYVAIDKALDAVRKTGQPSIPLHLRNAPTRLMKELGYGKGYVYAHDDPEGARQQTYLPDELKGQHFYEPSDHGTEGVLKKTLERLKPRD